MAGDLFDPNNPGASPTQPVLGGGEPPPNFTSTPGYNANNQPGDLNSIYQQTLTNATNMLPSQQATLGDIGGGTVGGGNLNPVAQNIYGGLYVNQGDPQAISAAKDYATALSMAQAQIQHSGSADTSGVLGGRYAGIDDYVQGLLFNTGQGYAISNRIGYGPPTIFGGSEIAGGSAQPRASGFTVGGLGDPYRQQPGSGFVPARQLPNAPQNIQDMLAPALVGYAYRTGPNSGFGFPGTVTYAAPWRQLRDTRIDPYVDGPGGTIYDPWHRPVGQASNANQFV